MTAWDVVTAVIPSGGIEDLSWNFNNTSSSTDNQVTYNWLSSIIAPGWVDTNLALWLKSNVGTSTLTDWDTLATWSDQSWNSLDASAVVSPIYRDNVNDNLNFHPVIDFDGTSQYMSNLANWAHSQSYYAVIIPDNQVDGTLAWQVPFSFDCDSWILSSWTCWLPFAGITLWAFTVAINDEVITHAIWSSANYRNSQIWVASYNAGEPMLIWVNENLSANSSDIYEKGWQVDNFTVNSYQTISAADYSIW
jgi:hypothetical protein